MTRRQRHLRDLADVPRRDDVAPRVRVGLEQLQRGADLVDVLARRRRPRPPLHAIDRTEIACVRGPFVPDGDAAFLQPAHVRVAAQEPQQLVDHRLGVHLLGGDQREAGRQVVAHLVAEQAAGSGAGAVRFGCAALEHQAQEILVRAVAIGTPLSLRPEPTSRTEAMPSISATVTTPDGTCPVTLHTPNGTGPVVRPSSCIVDAGGVRDTFQEMAASLAGFGLRRAAARRVLPARRLGAVRHGDRVRRPRAAHTG